MDNNIMSDLQQLFDEIEIRLAKAKKLIENPNSSSNLPDKNLKVLVDVHKKGGVVTADDWKAIGKKHGMDARGLGGFFVGDGSMVLIGDDKRALTERGAKMVKKWKENHK